MPERDRQSVGTAAEALEPLRRVLAGECAAVGGPPDPFRGLHLSEADVAAALGPARPGRPPALVASALRAWPPAALLDTLYPLTDFELAVLALALAPEVDERFGVAFAWLHDDITRRRPSPALALRLFATGPDESARYRTRFGAGATLVGQHLLRHSGADSGVPELSRDLVLDDQIRRLLLGEPGLDARLSGWCRLTVPAGPAELAAPLDAVLARLHGGGPGPRLALGGAVGLGQHRVAAALAATLGRGVLRVDLDELRALSPVDGRHLVGLLIREVTLLDAVLELAPAESLVGAPGWFGAAVRELVGGTGGPVVLRNDAAGPAPVVDGAGMLTVELQPPSAAARRDRWVDATASAGLTLDDDALDTLAGRYRLGGQDIESAARRASDRLRWGLTSADPLGACAAEARSRGGRRLARLAGRIVPRFSWDDLVLPDDVGAALRELCARAGAHSRVLDGWGFAGKLALGQGLTALFAGPSGTGKSMAAEVVAGALGLDLFRINLATVVDKYIGETEKNLDAVFRAAEDASGILLFDEADALFGKRSEVRDAHDRYANLEVSYLLQRLEEYAGLAILSTNLRCNVDDAFVRRLAAIVWFPFPDQAARARLWRRVWPDRAPVAELDVAGLADRFPLSGGGIKSAALAAAGLAAADGGVVTTEHVLRAVRREYQKMGRTLSAAELDLVGPGSPR